MKGSEGIRDVVKNHVVPDEEGNMDFELEQLPYEIGKNLYKYIKKRISQMQSNEKGRKKALQKRERKEAEKAKAKPELPSQAKAQVKKSEKPIKPITKEPSPAKLPKPDFSGYTVQ